MRRVRDRQQPPRGPAAPRGRVRPGRAGDEDPRQVPARARGRAVRRSSRRETYVKGFLRTYADYLGLDGQLYVDEYNSRFVAGDDLESRPRRSSLARRAPQPAPRDERRAARARDRSSLITIVVISAWKIVRQRHDGAGRRPHARSRAQARSPSTVPTSRSSAVGGSSYVAVHQRRPGGQDPLPGHGRPRPDRAVHGQAVLAQRQLAREPRRSRSRGKAVPLPGHRPLALTVTPSGVHTA